MSALAALREVGLMPWLLHNRKAKNRDRARRSLGLAGIATTIVFLAPVAWASGISQRPALDPPLAPASTGEMDAPAGGRTSSAALDRITKREPRLDGIVRRAGTGRGVTIYVF